MFVGREVTVLLNKTPDVSASRSWLHGYFISCRCVSFFSNSTYSGRQMNDKAIVAICETSSSRVQMNAYELVFECCFRAVVSLPGTPYQSLVQMTQV